MRSRWALLTLLSVSCIEQERIDFPPLTEGARTRLLQVPSGELWIFDARSSGGVPVLDPLGMRLDLFGESTTELGVEEGRLDLRLDSDPPGARTPTPLASYEYNFDWRESEDAIPTGGLLKVRACRDPSQVQSPLTPPQPAVCPDWVGEIGLRCDALLPQGCPSGTARFSRSGPCRPLAVDCPAGPWPALSPPAFHVRSGAGIGGDGTPERPLGTIAEAIQAGATLIGLSEGRHLALHIPAGVTVIGLCPGSTRLEVDGLIEGRVERVELPQPISARGASFDQVAGGAIQIAGRVTSTRSSWSQLSLSSTSTAIFEQTQLLEPAEVRCERATLNLQEVLATNAQLDLGGCEAQIDGAVGNYGLSAGSDVQITDAELASLEALGPRRFELRSTRVGQLTVDATDEVLLESCWIDGLVSLAASRLDLRRSSLEENQRWALLSAAELALEDVHLGSADLGPGGFSGSGEVDLRRVIFTGEIDLDGEKLRAEDLISTSQTAPDSSYDRPLLLRSRDVVIERATFTDPGRFGVPRSTDAIRWGGTTMAISDLRVAGYDAAIGAAQIGPFQLTVDRFYVDGPFPLAFRGVDRGSRVVLRDGSAPNALAADGFCAPQVALEQVDKALCEALLGCPVP